MPIITLNLEFLIFALKCLFDDNHRLILMAKGNQKIQCSRINAVSLDPGILI